MIDRVVVTVFPGYCFMSVLCIRSVLEHVPTTPITVIIDDFDLESWPNFVSNYQDFLSQQFCDVDIEFCCYSQLDKIDHANMGGWFRQQLVKLYVDQFVDEDNILLVDADVILQQPPKLDTVPAGSWPYTPISAGFNLYVAYMLNREPWLGTKEQNLSTSWVPVRYVSRQLIQALRRHVEHMHGKDFLDLHIDLMIEKKIVAYDPQGQTMIMSEFELLEVFRKHIWHESLPFSEGAAPFYHTSEKDWQKDIGWFESRNVTVPRSLWESMIRFGSNPVFQMSQQ